MDKYYVVLVNGAVATIARLSEQDGEALCAYVNDKSDALMRAEVVEQDSAATDLLTAKAEVEAEIEFWEV